MSTKHDPHLGSEAMFAIMGPTGAGKSSFIKTITGSDDAVVGETLESQTSEVRVLRWVSDGGRGRALHLVDTPGFDDSRDGVTDAEVLKMIAEFLVSEHQGTLRRLTGLVYLHSISDARVTGSARRNFRMFQGLCGAAALPNVVIATSKWGMVDPALGTKREAELRSKETLFKPLIDAGAVMMRHDDGFASASKIISYLQRKDAVTTAVVEELLAGKSLAQTSAGEMLNQEVQALIAKNKEDRIALEGEMKAALEAKDVELQRILAEERKRMKAEMDQLQSKQVTLTSRVESLTAENLASMKAVEGLRRNNEELQRARDAEKALQQKKQADLAAKLEVLQRALQSEKSSRVNQAQAVERAREADLAAQIQNMQMAMEREKKKSIMRLLVERPWF